MNNRNYFCGKCQQNVRKNEFYHQGKICKKCRSRISKEKVDNYSGIQLAEYLLHKSCQRALDRVKGNDINAYKGVKCQWTKPLEMKKALMKNESFWKAWVMQSAIYENNERVLSYRPSLDRIESDVSNKGHYYMENLQVLSMGENGTKANVIKCMVFFIKDMRIIRVADFDAIQDVMKEFKVIGYNSKSIKRDTGKIQYIGDGYSVLIQSKNGELKQREEPLYKVVYEKKKIIFDRETGEEYIIGSSQFSFNSGGIWFNEGQMSVS